MILYVSVFLELIPSFMITFGVMSMILVMQQIYRLANLMVEKQLAVLDVGLMLFYLMPQVVSITIPLGVVGSVFITVIRQSTDAEIISMRAAGMSLWKYSIPFLALGFAATIVTSAVTLWLQPIGYREYTDLQLRMVKAHADENLVPGKFNFDFGDKVIQVGNRLPSGEVRDIFITDSKMQPTSAIIMADAGVIGVEEESREVYFRLRDGMIYAPDTTQTRFKTMAFSRLNYLLQLEPEGAGAVNGIKRASTLELLSTIKSSKPASRSYLRNLLELNYRLSLPWACLVFVFASIPMAIVDPRAGKSGSFMRAVFLVVTYYIVWIGFKDMARLGSAPMAIIWLPLLLVLLYGMIRLWQTNSDFSMRSLLRRS